MHRWGVGKELALEPPPLAYAMLMFRTTISCHNVAIIPCFEDFLRKNGAGDLCLGSS